MTAAKEKMNTLTPAYLVQLIYPVQPSRSRSYTFRNPNLLAARQKALEKAKQAIAEKLAYQVIDITIDLIEIDRAVIRNQHTVIATVCNQRFHQTLLADKQGFEKLNDFTKKSLSPSLSLALNLERDHACNSPEIVNKSLAEVAEELAYYQQHGYSTNLPQHQNKNQLKTAKGDGKTH